MEFTDNKFLKWLLKHHIFVSLVFSILAGICIFFLLFLLPVHTFAQTVNPLNEVRYCGFVPRTASGDIKRRSDVLKAFQKVHACPSTGSHTGKCEGWAMDHVLPLACGGCDAVYNLAWVPNIAKSCKDNWCKDRYERKIYAMEPPAPDSDNCTNVIIPVADLIKK